MQTRAFELRVGYELIYYCPQDVPMILLVNIHYSRASDIVVPDVLITDPVIPFTAYRDGFGNWCNRLVAPAGRLRLTTDAVIRDSGLPDEFVPDAKQHAVEDLPEDTLVYLLGSRYCETDLLSQTAWQLFESTAPGWWRVQAICDYVHKHIAFDYQNARAHAQRRASLRRTNRRLPRLCAPGHHILPLHEHSGPLLHRIPGRRGDSAAVGPWRFRGLDRGLYRRTLACFRSPQ